MGLGSEADFSGRDVQGKAVFMYSMLGLPLERGGAVRLADAQGAAAVFNVHMLPGNMRYQAYPPRTNVPAFTVGGDDGIAVRDLIARPPPEQPVRVSVRLDVELVPNLQTALVWGTLPGATDETIYLIAHRDGWFDASGDNASGVASMLGLAEHYAAIPQAQRPRTIVFLGHRRAPQLGRGLGRRDRRLDDRQPRRAFRQDGAHDQRGAPVDRPDDGAAPLHAEPERGSALLDQHVHRRSSGTRAVRRGRSCSTSR